MRRLLLLTAAVVLLLPASSSAWPIGSYRGHSGCGYYSANGNQYAMCWVHRHVVANSVCRSNDQHHYSGWFKTPGGYYVRLTGHDHHVCAPEHSWPAPDVEASPATP